MAGEVYEHAGARVRQQHREERRCRDADAETGRGQRGARGGGDEQGQRDAQDSPEEAEAPRNVASNEPGQRCATPESFPSPRVPPDSEQRRGVGERCDAHAGKVGGNVPVPRREVQQIQQIHRHTYCKRRRVGNVSMTGTEARQLTVIRLGF